MQKSSLFILRAHERVGEKFEIMDYLDFGKFTKCEEIEKRIFYHFVFK
jgi:hypothetical protein